MRVKLFASLFGCALLFANPAWADTESKYLENLYLSLHQNPELSLQEFETAKRMQTELQKAGFEVTPGVGGTGLVAILENGNGPTLMLRADMDALPVGEQTGLSYASTASPEFFTGTKSLWSRSMAIIRVARAGETLDEMCFSHYGRTDQVLEAVLEINPALLRAGSVMSAGSQVLLPDLEPISAIETLELWQNP